MDLLLQNIQTIGNRRTAGACSSDSSKLLVHNVLCSDFLKFLCARALLKHKIKFLVFSKIQRASERERTIASCAAKFLHENLVSKARHTIDASLCQLKRFIMLLNINLLKTSASHTSEKSSMFCNRLEPNSYKI